MVGSEADRIKHINLIEVLSEEAESKRITFEEPDDLHDRNEAQIRTFFESLTVTAGAAKAEFSEPIEQEFKKWFPGLALSRTQCDNPRWRILCFANAGNAEDMYTSEGTGIRRTPSPLLEWCRSNNAECLAVQLPGRNLRKNEAFLGSCQEVAEELFPVIASRLLHVPYFIIAHSVGTWNAFEFLQLARRKGCPMPKKVMFSAMASPDIAQQARPWLPQQSLSEEDFKDECRAWDVNELVFSASMWPTYHPLMRADFTLFDQYKFQHEGKEPFTFPMATFYGSEDKKIKPEMVEGWEKLTKGQFTINMIKGHHLWPLQPASKTVWLQQIVNELDECLQA